MKWEYRVEKYDNSNTEAMLLYLQNLGDDGWELVAIDNIFGTNFFKRRKQDDKQYDTDRWFPCCKYCGQPVQVE
jgi:hypothetical protein